MFRNLCNLPLLVLLKISCFLSKILHRLLKTTLVLEMPYLVSQKKDQCKNDYLDFGYSGSFRKMFLRLKESQKVFNADSSKVALKSPKTIIFLNSK